MSSEALKSAGAGAATGSAFGPWGTVIGAGVGLLGGMLNKKKAAPKVDYKPVNLADEQAGAINANLNAEDSIETLLSRANRYSQGEANSLMEMAVPGYAKLSQKFLDMAGTNISDPYSLPKDVSDNLTRIAGERGITTGVRGQAADFSLLKDFGVNMLDYGNSRISQAQSLLSSIVGLSPRVSPMSPLSFYVTPQQQAAVTADNNTKKQAIDQGGTNASTAALNFNTANLWDSLARSAGMVGGYLDTKKDPKT